MLGFPALSTLTGGGALTAPSTSGVHGDVRLGDIWTGGVHVGDSEIPWALIVGGVVVIAVIYLAQR